MGSIFLTPQANSRHPFIDEASILTGAEVIAMVDTARENIVSQRATTTFEPGQHADSDDAAHLFRSDPAHHSEMMPPGY
jgi:hypothetical protein